MTDTQMLTPRQASIFRSARRAGREWADSGKRYDPSIVADVVKSLLKMANHITLSDDEVSFAVDELRDAFQTRVSSRKMIELVEQH